MCDMCCGVCVCGVCQVENAWYCGACQEHRQARKTLKFWRLPAVLIVGLKRYITSRVCVLYIRTYVCVHGYDTVTM